MKVVISSGHGKHIRGAAGPSPWGLDEVNEARKVVESVATAMRSVGVTTTTYHDDVSDDQDENLKRICDFHNAQGKRDLDVSVHFNSATFSGSNQTSNPVGTEVFYKTNAGMEVADEVVDAIANASGLKNRGPKPGNLYFLSNTAATAILIEVCFVNSKADCDIYRKKYAAICDGIAEAIAGESIAGGPDPLPPDPDVEGPPESRPVIGDGDEGPHVVSIQESLGVIPADGDFGSITESAVQGYQCACSLDADGIVGQETWAALDDLDARKAGGSDGLSPADIAAICDIVKSSAIAKYNWKDRGKMPAGYICGVACCFALAQSWLEDGDPAAARMARADTNNPDKDALSWYKSKFQALGMSNNKDGLDTLRHLFVMLLGLGPRESSGRYCEGRDMSASNVQSDTAEAGMYQTSWNIRSADSTIAPLLDLYWENPNGFLTVFQDGVKPDSNDLGNFGSGDGAKYQFLSKYAPAFHAIVTGLGMRSLRQHWGPINRSEVELREEADDMLQEVQDLIASGVVPPEPPVTEVPTITITIDPPGSARVVIVGSATS